MSILKGLVALFIFLQSSLFAEYLYKDEITSNSTFESDIQKMGEELYQKSGIKLILVMLKKLPDGKMVELEKTILHEFNTPTILLAFSRDDMKVDILVNDPSLYNYFDKKQVLSPATSQVQALILALFYSDSFERFKDILTNYGGTILPLLSQKAKPNEEASKYSAAMFNGYADIAMQVAKSKGIKLDSDIGQSNQISIMILKSIFYGVILYALFLYIRNKIKRGRVHE